MHRKFTGLIVFVLVACFCNAQTNHDTLALTLPEAEKIFLEKNLSLLIQQYNVDINKALVQQARYWDNPVLFTDQNLYDGKFFRHKSANNQTYGQVFIQLQQTIKTAGKRNKLIQLADDNVLTSTQQFNDLMRNLKFVLTTDFTNCYQLFATHAIYTREIGAMQKLATGMDAQLQAGNISQKDNVRIKALLFSLQSDLADVQRQIEDVQKELHLLLQQTGNTIIVPVIRDSSFNTNITLPQLLDSALNNRPDWQLAKTGLLTQEHNLSYQKALAVPDLTVGVEYDRLNSYVPNYWGLSIGLPVPIFNRNKGNIIAASTAVRQAATSIVQVQTQTQQQVEAAYKKLLIAAALNKNAPVELGAQYERLLQNIINGYQQRQVSLIEFVDFFSGYKETMLKELQQQTAWLDAAAELNFSTGSNIISIQ
jgi:cobalt-zinc-cadmium efflux system outer membrane protein